MYENFTDLLSTANGISEHVIAINLDIRGFSSFCSNTPDWDVGNYIKTIYLHLLQNYFKKASFYKPTGDGLIVIVPCRNEDVKELVNSVIEDCVEIVKTFSGICAEEPLINFPTPTKIGIGVSRGSICSICSKDGEILDYSGKVLNIASRLMDLARPSGIVIHSVFGIKYLKDQTKKLFSEDVVYLRGAAEDTPIKIHYLTDKTIISDSAHDSFGEPDWEIQKYIFPLKKLKELLHTHYTPTLTKKPFDKNKITVEFSYLLGGGYRWWTSYSLGTKSVDLLEVGNLLRLNIDMTDAIQDLEEAGASDDTDVTIEIKYPIK